jgi:hypothetical protein
VTASARRGSLLQGEKRGPAAEEAKRRRRRGRNEAGGAGAA